MMKYSSDLDLKALQLLAVNTNRNNPDKYRKILCLNCKAQISFHNHQVPLPIYDTLHKGFFCFFCVAEHNQCDLCLRYENTSRGASLQVQGLEQTLRVCYVCSYLFESCDFCNNAAFKPSAIVNLIKFEQSTVLEQALESIPDQIPVRFAWIQSLFENNFLKYYLYDFYPAVLSTSPRKGKVCIDCYNKYARCRTCDGATVLGYPEPSIYDLAYRPRALVWGQGYCADCFKKQYNEATETQICYCCNISYYLPYSPTFPEHRFHTLSVMTETNDNTQHIEHKFVCMYCLANKFWCEYHKGFINTEHVITCEDGQSYCETCTEICSHCERSLPIVQGTGKCKYCINFLNSIAS